MKAFAIKTWHFLYLCFGAFVFFCMVLYARHRLSLDKGQATAHWSGTSGKVTEAKILGTKKGKRIHSDGTGRRSILVWRFTYTYTVNGKTYEGRRVRYSARPPSGWDVVKKYPKGRQVTVYYDPDNPRDAVLERGTDPVTVAMVAILVGVVLLYFLFPLVYVPLALRRGRKCVRLYQRINQALRAMGFRFRPGIELAFGAEANSWSSEPEEVGFSLLEPRSASDPVGGYAVMERDNRLIELQRRSATVAEDGTRIPEEGDMLHICLETRWMLPEVWEAAGRRDSSRPIALSDDEKELAENLFFLCLGARFFRFLREPGEPETERWIGDPESELQLNTDGYMVHLNPDDERYALQPFDSGVEAFDGFFRCRQGGKRVRTRLSRADRARAVIEPLQPWAEQLHDVQVGQTVDVWIQLADPVGWDGILEDLPKLLDALLAFTERLEQKLIEGNASTEAAS